MTMFVTRTLLAAAAALALAATSPAEAQVVYYSTLRPVVAAPVTAYYAPVPVVGQLYRRGPLGVYRPVRSAYMIGY